MDVVQQFIRVVSVNLLTDRIIIDLIKPKYVMINLYEYGKLAEKDFFYFRLNNKCFSNLNKWSIKKT
jgi:hypothetical protein